MTADLLCINYLGVDWGGKRIGLALADSETRIALPFKTVATLSEVFTIIREEGIDEIVLGQPLGLQGGVSNSDFLSFARKLEEQAGRKVTRVDERMSSKAADARARGEKDKAPRDEMAAAIVLQDYLDSQN
jgi:putative Holliday junction resolvase